MGNLIERRSYIVLVAISIALSAAVFIANRQQEISNEHKFCQLITASLAKSGVVPKPSDPKADPKAEQLYEGYILVYNLGHSLGCV